MVQELARAFLPVVIASRVGDAMGSPTEGLSFEEIGEAFGWVSDFSGDGTDDSLMATLLANALIASNGYAGVDEWAAQLTAHRDVILAKRDRFFASVLHTVEKLRRGCAPRRVALGNMPSSSSAMCVWPVGLVNAGDPRAAAAHAYALAALIHVQEVDFCQDAAAAVAAAVASGLRPGTSIADACAAALNVLHPVSGEVMRGLIESALRLADKSSGYDAFREQYHAAYRQRIPCDSRETVPAAFGLALLARGDVRTAVEYGANFGRDTDTIASIAGAMCGAVGHAHGIPAAWRERLGAAAVESATGLAAELASTARLKAGDVLRNLRGVPGLVADGEQQ